MRVIGKAKTLFGNTKQISIELVVFILIVQDDDCVLARWHFEREQGLISGDRESIVRKRFVLSFRPAIRRFEERRARRSFLVAKSGRVNAKRTNRWGGCMSEASTGENKEGC